ncbi:MAG: SDR family oxidoreductase [Acidobacteriia bacterium]|nr:SDR family oxidoreductase [Terriglobia bacterium]
MRLQGKIGVVTGGGRGIGEAIALALAAEGCSVAVAGRTQAQLEKVSAQIQKLGRESLPVVCDICDPGSVAALFRAVHDRWGRLDILVNAAGESHSDLLARLSFETWQRMLAVNLTGTFLCSQEALRLMLPRKSGRIINIGSTAAKIGFRYAGAYAAAKHGVLGLTRSMALETATSGITVNAVCPGWVDTEMVGKAVQTISSKTKMTAEQARDMLAADSPQKRIFAPEEIAFATVWLACDESRGITGQAIDVSGGQVMS